MASTERPAGGASAEPEPVLVTRYPNRRLYDRSRARYVTLQEIADLVRGGTTVTVRDSRTGADLTRSILTQIILEYHPERMELFPVRLLNAMIRTNEGVLGFLREYLRQSLAYLELFQRQEAVNPLLQPLHWLRTFLPGAVLPPGEPDTAALTSRIAELERRLDELQGGPRKSEPKGAAKEERPGRDGGGRKSPARP